VAFEDTWIEGRMKRERFNHVLDHAARFQTIFFRGWGEPLTHPMFSSMVQAMHGTGARIVVSTNGWAPMPEEALPYIHMIEYRMGCGDVHVFENQHPGRRYNTILFNLARVCQWRRREPGSGLKLRLQFTKNRFTVHRIQDYMELAARFKPVEVQFCQNVFLVRSVDEEASLSGNVPADEIRRIDEEIKECAQELSIDLSLCENESHCLYNPLTHVFVNWKGQISPCRYTLLPVANERFALYRKGRVRQFSCVNLANTATPFDFSKWHLKIRNQFTPAALQKEAPEGATPLPQICLYNCSSVDT
jgi:hypothetical protein